jgi:hypothetical protein
MNQNQNFIRTTSGAQPKKDTPLNFDLSTQYIQKWIREKFRSVNDALVKANANDVPQINYEDIKIKTINFSNKFAPLLLTMPGSVLDRNNYNPNIPEMFQNTDEQSVPLRSYYWKLLSNWMYSKKDAEEFRSRQLQRALGVTDRNDVETFIYHTKVRVKSIDDGMGNKVRVVLVELNPERIFRSMLANADLPNQRFDIAIANITYTGNDDCIYEVGRSVTKRKKDKFSKEADKIARIMENAL